MGESLWLFFMGFMGLWVYGLRGEEFKRRRRLIYPIGLLLKIN